MKQLHPQEPDLLAAIHAAPRDDTPRLVYADWLQEHDQPELAEMIRLGIEIDKAAKVRQDVPRYIELDRLLRRRYVSPVPERWKCWGWDSGLPRIVPKVIVKDGNYREILNSYDYRRHGMYSFSFSIQPGSVVKLRKMLSHPIVGQARKIWIKPSRQITVEHIEVIAECPRIRLTGTAFLERFVSPRIGDAIWSLLVPIMDVGWWEDGHRMCIDPANPITWPSRFQS